MRGSEKQFETVDDYIMMFQPSVRSILNELRRAIKDAAPEAKETISYGMPAFKLNGILVYFAAQKNHIGFYPTTSGVNAFRKELSGYDTSKGTVRFPMDKPIPFGLVRRIVTYRLKEDSEKAARQKKASPLKHN